LVFFVWMVGSAIGCRSAVFCRLRGFGVGDDGFERCGGHGVQDLGAGITVQEILSTAWKIKWFTYASGKRDCVIGFDGPPY
jgi:hypothetical protein